jgi:hypothetical protein
MSKFLRIVKTDLYRSLLSMRFLNSVILVIFICILASIDNFQKQSDAVYIYDIMVELSPFRNIILIIAAIPFVTSFCSDWNNQYIKPFVIRTGVNNYSWSKVFVSAITSFLVAFLGLMAFVLIMGFKYSLYDQDISGNYMQSKPYGFLLSNLPIIYLAARIFCYSAYTVFWCILGLCISAIIPNRFVASTAPLISFYVVDTIIMDIPDNISLYFNTRYLSKGDQIFHAGALVHILYVFLFFIGLSLLMGYLFKRIVKRRVRNEYI